MDWFVANFATGCFLRCRRGSDRRRRWAWSTLKNPVHAALSLLATFLAVAVLFVLQHAEFLAAVQILVYAGGVMVLFLFVIMLVNVAQRCRASPSTCVGWSRRRWSSLRRLPCWSAAGVWSHGRWSAVTWPHSSSVEGQALGNTEAVGWSLYRDYLLPFEVVSVVLLVAMIGAIVLGRKEDRGGRVIAHRPLPRALPGPLRARRRRHGGAPQLHHGADVRRADPQRRQHQPDRLLRASSATSTGQVFAVFVITIAAAEAAIGLGIIIALVRLKQTVTLDQVAHHARAGRR